MNAEATSRPADCISDLTFDEWFAGELAPAQTEALDAHLAGCLRCQTKRAALQSERAAFLAAVPTFQALSARVERPRPRVQRKTLLGLASGALLAAAAMLLLVRAPDDPAGTRLKGSPHLGLFVKHGENVRRGASGERVFPGDTVRFTYSMDTARHLTIFGLDARGVVSRYFPRAATSALKPGANLPLDFGVELDDSPGRETVFGLFCQDAIDLPAVQAELERKHTLAAREGCVVDTLLLEKGTPR